MQPCYYYIIQLISIYCFYLVTISRKLRKFIRRQLHNAYSIIHHIYPRISKFSIGNQANFTVFKGLKLANIQLHSMTLNKTYKYINLFNSFVLK